MDAGSCAILCQTPLLSGGEDTPAIDVDEDHAGSVVELIHDDAIGVDHGGTADRLEATAATDW